MNSANLWIAVGAALGGLGVVAGAFGAHGLEGKLSVSDLETYEVAVRYQMYHALALILLGLFARWQASRWNLIAGGAFLLGTIMFSGLLYALVFTGVKILGAIVPIGGTLLILGWCAFAAAACLGKPGQDAG